MLIQLFYKNGTTDIKSSSFNFNDGQIKDLLAVRVLR